MNVTPEYPFVIPQKAMFTKVVPDVLIKCGGSNITKILLLSLAKNGHTGVTFSDLIIPLLFDP